MMTLGPQIKAWLNKMKIKVVFNRIGTKTNAVFPQITTKQKLNLLVITALKQFLKAKLPSFPVVRKDSILDAMT